MAIGAQTDVAGLTAGLQGFIQAQLGDAEPVTVTGMLAPEASGYSNETLLFELQYSDHAEPLVARLQPTGPLLYPDCDVDRQRVVMEALGAASAVPVPRVRWHAGEADSPFGRSFFVMDRLDGRVPRDDPPFTLSGWVLELSDAERSRLYDNGLVELARLHGVDIAGLGLEDELGRPELAGDPLQRQIEYYADYLRWGAEGESFAPLESALAWVREHRPREPEPTVISWGDARIGNMIFAEDLSVAAVLDWDMAWLGSPELDLGWWVFFDQYYTEGLGAALPGGFPDRAAVLARYAELTGHTPRHVDFYAAFAAFRGAVVAVRISKLLKAAGILAADSDMALNNPAIHTMSKLMGFSGSAASVAGYISKSA